MRPKPNFKNCEKLATEILISSGVDNFPIDVRKLKYLKNIKFESMQEYCRITNIPLHELQGSSNNDGFIVSRDGLSLILYNDSVCVERINWTLGHEVGHAVLGHTTDNDLEEVEAHFLAANLFMPNPVIFEIMSRGKKITEKFLIESFGVSPDAAKKKIATIKKMSWKPHLSFYRSNELISQLSNFIEIASDAPYRIEYDGFFRFYFSEESGT